MKHPVAKKQTRRKRDDLAGLRIIAGPRKANASSKVSNGREVLPGVDSRSAVARRYFDIQTAIVVDQGGADSLSEARLQLIRRFAAASVIAEQMEAALAKGKPINVAEHALLCSTLVRVARHIGINRVAKDVTDPLEYAKQFDLEAAE